MGGMQTTPIAAAREVLALVMTGIEYWLTIYPRARREIRRWTRRARRIPDPALRAAALATLNSEHLNPEAAAFFAVLASRRCKGSLVRLIVDFQIAYDYLDSINEDDATAPLRNGLQLAPGAQRRGEPGGVLRRLLRASSAERRRRISHGARALLPGRDRRSTVHCHDRAGAHLCGRALRSGPESKPRNAGGRRNAAGRVDGDAGGTRRLPVVGAGRGRDLVPVAPRAVRCSGVQDHARGSRACGRSVLPPDLRNQRTPGQPRRCSARRAGRRTTTSSVTTTRATRPPSDSLRSPRKRARCWARCATTAVTWSSSPALPASTSQPLRRALTSLGLSQCAHSTVSDQPACPSWQ